SSANDLSSFPLHCNYLDSSSTLLHFRDRVDQPPHLKEGLRGNFAQWTYSESELLAAIDHLVVDGQL
ncbi:hypothetical protein TYRP_016756, partial [Tyrophagus putrescentiae]